MSSEVSSFQLAKSARIVLFSPLFLILLGHTCANNIDGNIPGLISASDSGQVDESISVFSHPDQSLETEDNNDNTPVQVEDQLEEKIIQVPYTSVPVYLTHLAKMESYVQEALENYEIELEKRLDMLKSYRRDYDSSVKLAFSQKRISDQLNEWSKAVVISSHPFLTFRMIRRYSLLLNEINDHIWKNLENELWEKLEKLRGSVEWPTEVDLNSAAHTLIRIQNIHDFDIHFFASGVIRDYPLQIGLTAKQCLEISKIALEAGDITAATEWFQVAHSKTTHGRQDNSVGMDELTEVWEETYRKTIWPLNIFKTHDVFSESKALLRKSFENLKMNRTFEHRQANFKALCRGDNLRSPAEELNLLCYLDYSIHPYWLIHPLKVEIHNWDPIIYQVYDFVRIQNLIDISISDTIPASVASVQSGKTATQNVFHDKTFTSVWISDEAASPSLQKLFTEISLLTSNLGMVGPQFHISSYAVGNHYEPCAKCLKMEDQVLQYGSPKHVVQVILHAPDRGGEIAFTRLGALVRPQIGSVLVYNILDEIEEIDYTLHGSCPVVIGQKWVATKWVY